MNTKKKLEELLAGSGENYVSGSEIAAELGLTRAAVWKNIKQLAEEGYEFDSSTKLGYKLGEFSDPVTEYSIKTALGRDAEKFEIEVLTSTDSTNNALKKRAVESREWSVVIAGEQSSGRGRMGRSFFSPKGSGIYISVLLKPSLPAEQSIRVTTAAAVAACLAIEDITDEKPSIKWVNDVFVGGKKCCGILTEASLNIESGGMDWVVMGIGFNVLEPDGGFPAELSKIAGSICKQKSANIRSRIAASFLRHFYDICSDLPGPKFSEEYKKRSFILGKRVNVLRGGTSRPALALDIDDECRLLVEYEDGSREALSSGEVSIRTE